MLNGVLAGKFTARPIEDILRDEYADFWSDTRDYRPAIQVASVSCQPTFNPKSSKEAIEDMMKSIQKEVGAMKFKTITIPAVKRIVYHDPATIVFWQDGTKTVVKCMDGEPFEKYAGFCAALAKKVFGSTSKAKKVAGAKKKGDAEE